MGKKNGFGKLFRTGKMELICSGIWDGDKNPMKLSNIFYNLNLAHVLENIIADILVPDL